MVPTARSSWLLNEDGADPYLEQNGSLFLLHWWLLAPPCLVATWWYAFCLSPFSHLKPDLLSNGILRAAAVANWKRAPEAATLHRDIRHLIRMYTPGSVHEQPRTMLEDLADRPFSALGMMSVADDGSVHMSPSADARAPAAVVTYACLDYASRFTPAAGSISTRPTFPRRRRAWARTAAPATQPPTRTEVHRNTASGGARDGHR
ncbi:hypothetical protein ABIE67_000153 [Streptomyces sp. V4I8]